MRFGVRTFQIVTVVCRDERNPGLIRNPDQMLIHSRLRRDLVALNFKIKMILAENLGIFQGDFFCLCKFIPKDRLRYLAGQTCRKSDQSLMMFGQELEIDPWTIIESLGKTLGDQTVQIDKALLILGQKYQMMRLPILRALLQKSTARSDITFAPEDRMDPLLLHNAKKIDRSVHHSMVGDGTGRHAEFFKLSCQIPNTDRSVQEAVFGMEMQMGKPLE